MTTPELTAEQIKALRDTASEALATIPHSVHALTVHRIATFALSAITRAEAAEKEAEGLRRALEWYANEHSWYKATDYKWPDGGGDEVLVEGDSPAQRDEGDFARAALTAQAGEG